MSQGRLALAIVGCGDVARYTALFARLNPRIRLVACCDADAGRAAAFARRYGIAAAYASYDELLAQAPADAIYLAVPHHLHYSLLAQAVARDKAVLLEKPLARTLAEGQAAVALVEARGARVGVNYQYRYDTGCYALARAVQNGDLGEISHARCNLAWHRDEAYFGRAAWHGRLATAGGGTLLTQGSHLLDVALWALGGRPCAALGRVAQRRFRGVEVEDLALGIVEMAGGALLEISSAMTAASEQALSIEVYGATGTAIYRDRPWPHVSFQGVRGQRVAPPAWGVHALQRSLEGFRAWVAQGRPYLTPAHEALPVLAAVDAIYRSAQTGRRELIDIGKEQA